MNEKKITILQPLADKNVLISACLLGINCKYNGGNNHNPLLISLAEAGYFIPVPVCPEQLGGLMTPRSQCEIENYDKHAVLRVKNIEGKYIEENLFKGAEETVKIAGLCGVKKCLMKEGSPSCGVEYVYDGTFSGKKITGMGICSYELKKKGYDMISSSAAEFKTGITIGLFERTFESKPDEKEIIEKGGFVIE
jgi:uncharacterized protein YbbK (DUF523 family)